MVYYFFNRRGFSHTGDILPKFLYAGVFAFQSKGDGKSNFVSHFLIGNFFLFCKCA